MKSEKNIEDKSGRSIEEPVGRAAGIAETFSALIDLPDCRADDARVELLEVGSVIIGCAVTEPFRPPDVNTGVEVTGKLGVGR